MNDKDLLKMAKDLFNDINEQIRKLSEVLDRTGYEYDFNLETIDYSICRKQKKYTKLNVTLKQDLPVARGHDK